MLRLALALGCASLATATVVEENFRFTPPLTGNYHTALTWISDSTAVAVAKPDDQATRLGLSTIYLSTNADSASPTFTRQLTARANISSIATAGDASQPDGRVVVLCEETRKQIWLQNATRSGDFTKIVVPFSPRELRISVANHQNVMGYDDLENDLWLSTDGGRNWRLILKNCVHKDLYTKNGFQWGVAPYDPPDTIWAINQTDAMGTQVDRVLLRSQDGGGTWTLWRTHVRDLTINAAYITTTTPWALRTATATGYGERGPLEEAFFPVHSTGVAKDWQVLDESEGCLFAVVDHHQLNVTTDTYQGESNLYVSGTHGRRFSMSLRNVLFVRQSDRTLAADFMAMKAVRGVYLATEHIADRRTSAAGYHRTMITFDKGGQWQIIPAPSAEATTCRRRDNCSLHLHLKVVDLRADVEPVLSAIHAPGIALATGATGQNLQLNAGDNNVYLTQDGAVTWTKILTGPHRYAFANRGSIICAVAATGTLAVRWSTDYGVSFTNVPITMSTVRLLVAPPGVHTARVILVGSANGVPAISKVDFSGGITRNCGPSDYIHWTPSGRASGASSCWLGSQVTYNRRRASASCLEVWTDNERPDDPISETSCACSRADYDCDRGFLIRGNDECVQVDLEPGEGSGSGDDTGDVRDQAQPPDDCVPGATWFFNEGFRKVPANTCTGCAFASCETRLCPDAPVTTTANPNDPTVAPTGISPGPTGGPGKATDDDSGGQGALGAVIGILGAVILGGSLYVYRRHVVTNRMKSYSQMRGANGIYDLGAEQSDQYNNPTYGGDNDDDVPLVDGPGDV